MKSRPDKTSIQQLWQRWKVSFSALSPLPFALSPRPFAPSHKVLGQDKPGKSDIIDPEKRFIWLTLGKIWLLLLIVSFPLSIPLKSAVILIGFTLISILYFGKLFPTPRFHPAFNFLLFLALLKTIQLILTPNPQEHLSAYLQIYGLPLCALFLIIWLIRDTSGLKIGVYALIIQAISFGIILPYLLPNAWQKSPIQTFFSLYPLNFDLSPLTFRLYPLTIKFSVILSALLLLGMYSQLLGVWRKEIKRWKTPRFERDLYISGVLLAPILLAAVLFLRFNYSSQLLLGLSTLLGLTFSGREILVKADCTRHPRRHLTPLHEYLREYLLAASSTLCFISGISSIRSHLARNKHKVQFQLHADGDIYCPYQSGIPQWVPVCLHLHSNRWEGMFSPQEMVEHYVALGAKAVILTEHNRISKVDSPASRLIAYEHGWGPHHHHILVLDIQKTLVDLFPYGASFTAKQHTLARLRKQSSFLILAHPLHRRAWLKEDIIQLDYDAVEIFNKSCPSLERWDQALTAGRLVWGIAGDDNHDLRSPHQSAKRYILVDSRTRPPDSIPQCLKTSEVSHDDSVDDLSDDLSLLPTGATPHESRSDYLTAAQILYALRTGQFISLQEIGTHITIKIPPDDAIRISRFDWDGQTLTVETESEVEKAEIISCGSVVESYAKAKQLRSTLRPEMTHCRLMIYLGKHTVALNPLVKVARMSRP